MAEGVVGYHPELRLEGESGGIGVDPCPGWTAAQLVGLGTDNGPDCAVLVEGTRRKREELLLLCVIQHPVEIFIGREVGEQGRGLDGRQGRTYDGPGASQVSLGERDHGLLLDDVEVAGGERESPVRRGL